MAEKTASTARTAASREQSGSVMGIVMALALLAVVIGTMFLFGLHSSDRDTRNNAIAAAANDVGNAANKVGNAASKVGNAAENAARNVRPADPKVPEN
ncbi:MAG: hypothetical protein P8Y48_11955 [Novosphingobium sp.]